MYKSDFNYSGRASIIQCLLLYRLTCYKWSCVLLSETCKIGKTHSCVPKFWPVNDKQWKYWYLCWINKMDNCQFKWDVVCWSPSRRLKRTQDILESEITYAIKMSHSGVTNSWQMNPKAFQTVSLYTSAVKVKEAWLWDSHGHRAQTCWPEGW